jgi:capsular polysaccharide transport system permease protein
MTAENTLSADAATGPARASRSWLAKRKWFVVFVIIPTILATLYYGLFAADVYTSESRFVIKSPDQKRPQLSTLANLVQTTGLSGGQQQANEVLEFVRSRDALRSLEKTISIESRFASNQADILSRYPKPLTDDSFESLYRFYGKMVGAGLDSETGTAILTVKAFTPDDAYKINEQLLSLSEDMVNRLNSRVQSTAIAEAEKQVTQASQRVKQARIALSGYRNSQELIDPAKQATGAIEISNELIAQRAAMQAQLETMQRLTPQNPSIPALQQRVAAISAQVAGQDRRVAGDRGAIASKLGEYENLSVEQEFATESLNAANAALVQARTEAQRQQFYLERIVNPNKPDMPLLPNRLMSIIIVAAAAICLYFIGWMLVVGIIEHAPEE